MSSSSSSSSSSRSFLLASSVLLACLIVGISAQNGAPTRLTKQMAIQWHDKLYSTTNTLGAPGGGASGLRGWAMMLLAMFDAHNVVEGRPFTSFLDLSAMPNNLIPSAANPVAAAIAAAQVVLDGLIPGSTPAATTTMLKYSHLALVNIQLGMLPSGASVTMGVSIGQWVGQRLLANRTGDGHPPNNCNNWPNPATPACPNSVPNGPAWDAYQYNLPFFSGPPNSPGYPQVRPFGIPSYTDARFAVPAPPARNSPEWLTEWQELYHYGAVTNASQSWRTTATDNTALFHDGNFGSQIGWAADVLATTDIQLQGSDLLRLLALTAMSSHDSHATHWYYKYFHKLARPVTAYRYVDPSNTALYAYQDPAWFPLLPTSQTPEYPSGHASRTGGVTESFKKFFGDVPPGGSFKSISYSDSKQGARTYTSFSQFQQEVMTSRTWGGVHWRSSGIAGKNLAVKVTDFIWSSYLLPNTQGKKKIYFGVLWPMQSPSYPQGVVGVNLAVEQINNDSLILPGYQLVPVWKDNNDDAGLTYFKALELCGYDGASTKCKLPVLLGPVPTASVDSAATVSKQFNVPHVLAVTTNSGLADKSAFPNVNRMGTNEIGMAATIVQILLKFKWDKIAVIYTSERASQYSDLLGAIRNAGETISIITTQTFQPKATDITLQMQEIKKSGARIIIPFGQPVDATLVFKTADKLGMIGRPYVYVGTFTWFQPAFYNDATNKKLAQGCIAVVPQISTTSAMYKKMTDGWTLWYKSSPSLTRNVVKPVAAHAFYMYDAVFLIAQAFGLQARVNVSCADPVLKAALPAYQQQWCNWMSTGMSELAMNEMIRNVSTNGTTGFVKLDATGERQTPFDIQIIKPDGSIATVGERGLDTILRLNEQAITWPAGFGAGEIPVAVRKEVQQLEVVSDSQLYAIWAVTSLLMACLIALLVFNITFSDHPIIRLSSPNINSLVIGGAMVILSSLYFNGIGTNRVDTDQFVQLCAANQWLNFLGFVVMFGCLFAKTFRIYRIFHAKRLQTVRISDARLFGISSVITVLAVAMCTAWQTLTPPSRSVKYSAPVPDPNNLDVAIVTVTESCSQSGAGNIMFNVFRVVLLLLGSWMAVETRGVRYKELNDSKQIGLAIYTTALFVGMLIPITLFVENTSALHLVVSIFTFLNVSLVMFFIFYKKVGYVVRNQNETDSEKSTDPISLVKSKSGSGQPQQQQEVSVSGKRGGDTSSPPASPPARQRVQPHLKRKKSEASNNTSMADDSSSVPTLPKGESSTELVRTGSSSSVPQDLAIEIPPASDGVNPPVTSPTIAFRSLASDTPRGSHSNSSDETGSSSAVSDGSKLAQVAVAYSSTHSTV